MALTGDGRRAVSALADHTLRGWDLESGQELAYLSTEGIYAFGLTGDGQQIVMGDGAGNVYFARLWQPDGQ